MAGDFPHRSPQQHRAFLGPSHGYNPVTASPIRRLRAWVHRRMVHGRQQECNGTSRENNSRVRLQFVRPAVVFVRSECTTWRLTTSHTDWNMRVPATTEQTAIMITDRILRSTIKVDLYLGPSELQIRLSPERGWPRLQVADKRGGWKRCAARYQIRITAEATIEV
ncbi:hypothetical protein SODALDRAFT_363611 [Sodiomyces alkalinus F11]|uniref:Uncharacterized protein n=1 Tax=Sodiomyces alkalinus (strain CBS 110278 / VKM F-3762 / F11) TaxID=1314773 RepID=A0A3N2PK89_SODAK|nr:hypothetical protein SODALDRAFT_363611 [Sodiomyces alkalinus F11]ROT34923.1 hypothetical protein SODALDRAFT_363611 [Sodiomyces alkalinus F11]